MTTMRNSGMTVVEAVRSGKEILANAGIFSSEKESEILLAHLLGQELTNLYLSGNKEVGTIQELPLPEEVLRKFLELISIREKHKPLAYILGYQYFYGRSFRVQEGVFIPRFDSEVLVHSVLKYLRKNFSFKTGQGVFPPPLSQERIKACVRGGRGFIHVKQPVVFEWGVGSGVIIVSLALEFPFALYSGVEKDEVAYKITLENINRFGLTSKVKIYHCNGFTYPKNHIGRKIDFFISNPPYVKKGEIDSLPLDVKKEPLLALNGGEEGFEISLEILRSIRDILNNEALIFFEVGNITQLVREAKSLGFTFEEMVRDLSGEERVIVLKWRG